jgi:lipid II:glycine glycyltransferase (peptidoglycan interpeptide bridge formation enzyme)
MSEILKLKGVLHEKKLQKQKLIMEADTHIKHIRDIFADAVYMPVTEIDVEGAYILAEKILNLQREIKKIEEEIKRIEKELR